MIRAIVSGIYLKFPVVPRGTIPLFQELSPQTVPDKVRSFMMLCLENEGAAVRAGNFEGFNWNHGRVRLSGQPDNSRIGAAHTEDFVPQAWSETNTLQRDPIGGSAGSGFLGQKLIESHWMDLDRSKVQLADKLT